MKTELVCIVCPRGCHLSVENGNVSGNFCSRGEEYAKAEVENPVRTLTSIVKIQGSFLPVCSVKTSIPVPKKQIYQVMKTLEKVVLKAPVHIGDTVIENVCGTGANWVVTKEIL